MARVKNMKIGRPKLTHENKYEFNIFSQHGFLELGCLEATKFKEISTNLLKLPKKEIVNNKGIKTKEVYCNSDLSENHDLLKIATDDKIVGLLSEYFGCLPKIQFLTAWKTFHNENELSEMFFHMDHHGHKFAKFFMYLTDVHEGEGHHEFVTASHSWSSFKKILSSSSLKILRSQVMAKRRWKGDFWMNNEVVARFLPENLKKVTGTAGTMFLEDTGGLHRGTVVNSEKPRLIFQVLFTPMDSQKDPCIKGKNLDAYDLCKKSSALTKRQFDDMCSHILSIN